MSEYPRILGLDVGDRRIGIAISDPLGNTAAGLDTIARINMQTDVATIADIAKRHHVVEIVIGLPSNLDGSEEEQALQVMAFGKKLAQATGLTILYEEERLTSISSIRTLNIQETTPRHSRDLVDRQAAAIILQKHLDRE